MHSLNKITIVGFDHALASAITGAIDLFSLAGITWNHIHHRQPEPVFEVTLASPGGEAIHCINRTTLLPHCALEDVTQTDLILIPSVGGQIADVGRQQSDLIKHIQRLFHSGSKVASNCTGAFLLAAAGLLNNKMATTHWGYETQFKQAYPNVKLDTSRLVTHDDGVYCAGGGVAWLDLVLLLIEDFCGEQVAEETAKAHVLDLTRTSQRAYTSMQQKTLHGDSAISKVQHHIINHFSDPLNLDMLADMAGLSQRTLIRRFKSACDMTPLQYIQSVRIEQASKLLDTTTLPIDAIVYRVGYADSSTFVQLFKRWVGMSPQQFRARRTNIK